VPSNKALLGQYFTPRHVADLMVSLIRSERDKPVLEPSAGAGVFVGALHDVGFSNITAVELDATLANYENAKTECRSFVSWQPGPKFSAVIGNPPYIRWKNLGSEQRVEIQSSQHWGKLFNSLSDYLTVFVVNAVDSLVDGGELVFITPSFWFHTQHAAPVREFLRSCGGFTDIVCFGESRVFEKVSSAIVIFRFVKTGKPAKSIRLFQYVGGRTLPLALSLRRSDQFSRSEIPQFGTGSDDHWTLADQESQDSLNLFEAWASHVESSTELFAEGPKHARLGEFVQIANGMVSGLDRAFKAPPRLLDSLTRDELAVIRRVAKGVNLRRLLTPDFTEYIDIPAGLSESLVRAQYPNLIRHLEAFREDLEKRYSYGRTLPFWEWAFRRSEKFLTSDATKIFVPCKERMTNKTHARFCLAPVGCTATQDVSALAPLKETQESVLYIAAFLTLDEISWWITQRGLMKGGIAEFSERPIASMPFRPIDWSNPDESESHGKIVALVESSLNGSDLDIVLREIRQVFISDLGLPT
jgi:adenine-specific DNA-methyltransferase